MINNDKSIIPENLLSPPAAQTETTIALVWDKPKNASGVARYEVYVNGKLHGSSQSTDYTAVGLEHNQEYEIYVHTVLIDGRLSEKSNTIKVATRSAAQVFNIVDFGAIGDGETINTGAIQSAIDACTLGGKVYIPKGVFLTGAIYLKDHMTLYIEEGGVLLGSSDIKHYPLHNYRFEGLETACYASLINTDNLSGERISHLTIEGAGKIDANGSQLRQSQLAEGKGKPGRAICLRNVDYLYLKGITVKQSPAWCVHFIYCNHVSINNIKIYTKKDEQGNRYYGIANGDGLDPDSSSNIYIFNSMIASQDDCIAIKSGRDEEGRRVGIPSENIRITNCSFKSGFGVAVGSEMSGSVRNVLVQDCSFDDVYSIGSIKAPRGRGGVVENIRYEDIVFKNNSIEHKDCRWFRGAIYIDQFYSHEIFNPEEMEEISDGTAKIKDILFKNIELDTVAGNAIYLTGLPESLLENVHLENIQAIGKYGMKANNIRGLVMKNVSVTSREDEPFVFNNVEPEILNHR